MKIGIIGTGWLGNKLIETFPADTHWVLSTTTPSKAETFKSNGHETYLLDFNQNIPRIAAFLNCDIILISVPSSKRKPLEQLEGIYKNISAFLKEYQGKIIFFSSTGIYPDTPVTVTEETYPLENLNPHLSVGEQILMQNLPQTCVFRFGGLMGGDHTFMGYYSSEAAIRDPYAPVNHIHYEDIAGIIWQAAHADIEAGVYNIVSPEHPTKKEIYIYQTTAKQAEKHLPTEGKVVSPEKIIKALHYQFKHPNPIYY